LNRSKAKDLYKQLVEHIKIIKDGRKQVEGLLVDLCSRCGHYIKTIDLRELPGSIIVPLDDAATWHLDLIAQENLEGQEIKRS
jgi:hypothetical protein